MNAQTWQSLGALAGALATISSLIGLLLNRTRLILWLVNRSVLVAMLRRLEAEVATLRLSEAIARQSASSWESAAKAGAFSREEAERLVERVDRLERKHGLLIAFTRGILAHNAVLIQALLAANIPLPAAAPTIPHDLEGDLQ